MRALRGETDAPRATEQDEQALRRWIYLLHTASPPTVQGLGLASSQPSSRTPPLPEMPQALVDTGSDSKWDRLRIGAKAAGEGDVGQGMCEGKFGEWLEEYRVMQEEVSCLSSRGEVRVRVMLTSTEHRCSMEDGSPNLYHIIVRALLCTPWTGATLTRIIQASKA